MPKEQYFIEICLEHGGFENTLESACIRVPKKGWQRE